jgi:hemoglobin
MSTVPTPTEGAASAAQTPYALLGGEAALRALVERFYDLMELEPQYAAIRRLHAPNLSSAREKLFLFLSGWLGGPSLYIERHGHPMLRARHLPFAIGITERDQWMACMSLAMADVGVAGELQARLRQAFFQTADWMRNRPG